VTDFHDVAVCPLPKKSQAYAAVDRYFIERGVPTKVHSDNAKEMTIKKEWKKTMRRAGIKSTYIEPETSFQLDAERSSSGGTTCKACLCGREQMAMASLLCHHHPEFP